VSLPDCQRSRTNYERFITPSIFEEHSTPDWPVIDEWTLCEKLGHEGCYDVLKQNWDSFASIDDFWKIKNAGFNVIRIPVGYWSYVEPWGPYVQGAAPYLEAAVDWARETGLKIVIDLHGAPKSQNGFDHAGRKAPYPEWGDSDSLSHTHAALKVIEDKYAAWNMQDVVVAIQFLNEPYLAKLDREMVKQFYQDAFYNLREISDTPAILHDGFQDPSWMDEFLTPQDNNAQGVIVDRHEYQIFDESLIGLSVDQHRSLTCNTVSCLDVVCARTSLTQSRRATTRHSINGVSSESSPVPSPIAPST
jgi:glucan 1,3-beta-glucosidase